MSVITTRPIKEWRIGPEGDIICEGKVICKVRYPEHHKLIAAAPTMKNLLTKIYLHLMESKTIEERSEIGFEITEILNDL